MRAARRAGEILPYVYTGNISRPDRTPGDPRFNELTFTDTYCPSCGGLLVARQGYRVDSAGLVLKEEAGGSRYYCAHCGKAAPIGS
jgi:predicted RNA-binding Zn-ribbon protein involved in translation (DUF1610 family)